MSVIPTATSVTDAEWKRQVKQAVDPVLAGKKNVIIKTASYSLSRSDDVTLCNATGGAITITLPNASQHQGLFYWIKKTDASANAVTVSGGGANIDGSATFSLATKDESCLVTSDGSNWFTLASI